MKHNPKELQRAADAARLLKAAEILRTKGWRNNSRGENGVCILQALAMVDGLDIFDWTDVIPPPMLYEHARRKLATDPRFQYDEDLNIDLPAIYTYNDYVCDGQFAAIKLLEDAALDTLAG